MSLAPPVLFGARQQRRRRRGILSMSKHRKAPLPPHWTELATPGICRWCDQPVLNTEGKPRRSSWHPECVTAFKLIHWPAETRKAIYDRDHGICARCGVDSESRRRMWLDTWQLWSWLARKYFEDQYRNGGLQITSWGNFSDIVRKAVDLALKEAGSTHAEPTPWQHDHIRPLIEANGDIAFWQLDNIQTLCTRCHVQKGKEDNRRRKEQGSPPLPTLSAGF